LYNPNNQTYSNKKDFLIEEKFPFNKNTASESIKDVASKNIVEKNKIEESIKGNVYVNAENLNSINQNRNNLDKTLIDNTIISDESVDDRRKTIKNQQDTSNQNIPLEQKQQKHFNAENILELN
jgi:hypothetical protein